MNIFGVPEAKHYCSSFQQTAGNSNGSLGNYVTGALKGVASLKEGTLEFNSYRDCVLREVERCLFLAISNYRRALDLMMPGASSWAHVTLYYSSYFAARALIGMFGGWIGNRMIIEVAASQPGNQELIINRKVQSTYSGSHERFWDLFYGATASLVPWVDPKIRVAITPVSSTVTWQSENRNEVNYDSFSAFQLASSFQANFDAATFPASLPGHLSTQFSISEGLLLITSKFVREFGLTTDALDALVPAGPRRAKLERLVFRDRAPSLVNRTKWRSIVI